MATGILFPNERTCHHSHRLYKWALWSFSWTMVEFNHYIDTNAKKSTIRGSERKIGYMGKACWYGISSLYERSEPRYCYWQASVIGEDKQSQGGGWRSPGHYVKTAKIVPRHDYCCRQKEPMYCQLGKPIGKSLLLLFWFLWWLCVDRLCWCKKDLWWDGPLYMLLDGWFFFWKQHHYGHFPLCIPDMWRSNLCYHRHHRVSAQTSEGWCYLAHTEKEHFWLPRQVNEERRVAVGGNVE